MSTIKHNLTPVERYIRWARDFRLTSPDFPATTWEDVARSLKTRDPALCLEVMESIGSWPSSEPELRALQAVWP